MRILRLRLANYRGIRERELCFPREGVTVVHGPNEIGKSSLAEAIDLVLEELDSAAKQRVRQVQPVDRDAGSEIEIEIESGPYLFTLSKRFHRQPATQLRVVRPRAENRTGREAHARVQQILDETLDRELWRALRVEQGRGLEQVAWRGQPALAAALDRAAGLVGAGAREETLREAVREEYLAYFTPGGRERRDFDAKEREVAKLRQEAGELERTLASLERDVLRDAELRESRPALELEVAASESALRECEATAARSESLREALATARARSESAALEERQALQESRARNQLLAARALHEADAIGRAEELESGEPELLAARAEADHASGAHAAARDARERAANREARCRAELEWLRARQELASWRQREARVAAARVEAERAAGSLRALPVDETRAEAIGRAERAAQRARDRLEAEEPRVRIAAHAPLEATLDGRLVRIAAGEQLEQRVSDSLWLSLPGVADVGVVAGAGAAEFRKQLDEAESRWRELCVEARVEDYASALRALSARTAAAQALAAARRSELELLAGESHDSLQLRGDRLAARAQALESRALASGAETAAGGAPCDADTVALRLSEAEAAQVRARDAEKSAAAREDAAASRAQALEQRARETEMRLALARRSFEDQESRLAAARAECSDEELARRLEAKSARARMLDAEAREAERLLGASDPDEAAVALESARRRREHAESALRNCRDEQIELAARLEVRGEQGLFEQREETLAALWRAEREARGARRRAGAARLLYETLEAERAASQRAYAGPLRARIEALGREVFGDDFAIELDESLRVSTRVQRGVALAFEQLSAGAREQIALCARLACATLVSEDGGAPIVLDDALGHSDPQRLAGLGRALALAGKRCQILVLTCDPARYRHVEGAHLVPLAP
ncbi:MAG TPA: AAA family ATPase [Myxococcota bacterium]|nr:AAA family ATPase [Myxococcota bacterium]